MTLSVDLDVGQQYKKKLPCIGYWDGQYCRMSRVPTNIPQKRFGQLLHGRTCPVNDAVLCEFRCIFDLS